MRKALLTALLAMALAGCSAGDVVPPGQAPATPPTGSAPATQPANPQPPATSSPAQGVPATQPPATPPPAANPATPAPPPKGGGIRFNPYTFVSVPTQNLPAAARDWLQTNRDNPAFAIYRDGKDAYLLATIGQRNSGGYSVAITSVGDSNGQIEVVVQETTPKPGQMVTMVVTWPVAAVKVTNLPDQPVHFVHTSTAGTSQTYQATVIK